MSGEKRFLGFVETDTENAQVLTPFLQVVASSAGLDVAQGVLVILDGGKGLRDGPSVKAFHDRALVRPVPVAQARQNVVRYTGQE